MTTSLSTRLQLIFDNLIAGHDVWDFCCDHGYLGGAAYKSQQFKNIYFVDSVTTIIEKLKSRFYKYLFDEKNESLPYFVLQSGQKVNEPVYGTACITGVGAHVIYEILNGLAENNFLKAQRLILGPHRDAEKLLLMLQNNKYFDCYKLSMQKNILENNRNRQFFIFDL